MFLETTRPSFVSDSSRLARFSGENAKNPKGPSRITLLLISLSLSPLPHSRGRSPVTGFDVMKSLHRHSFCHFQSFFFIIHFFHPHFTRSLKLDIFSFFKRKKNKFSSAGKHWKSVFILKLKLNLESLLQQKNPGLNLR